VKIARAATGRSAVIAFTGSFHGRTFMGMTLTGKVTPYKAGFGPMMSEVFHAPFPVELHGMTGEASLAALDKLFKADIDPASVAAIIIEPVQGEGGFYVAPRAFMRSLRKICDENGILLIADEVQTGFARTGRIFAMEHFDVAADITCMAKSLAGGLPLAAVTGRAEVMDAPMPGGLGGTYGGNPLGIAAANTVLDVIIEEDLCARAEWLGGRLRQWLESMRPQVPEIADIRGLGFMTAVEFCKPATMTPDAGLATRLRTEALARGLILLGCGIYGNVIRFLAPLTIEDAVFNEALTILEAALIAARKEAA
jgi:4-aminobutyrate aminotransferase